MRLFWAWRHPSYADHRSLTSVYRLSFLLVFAIYMPFENQHAKCEFVRDRDECIFGEDAAMEWKL